jgi:uncharacterized phage-associated protein
MIENKTFCDMCRKDVIYNIETSQQHGTLKGEDYEFIGKKAICTECGHEVYVPEIDDGNLTAIYDAYRMRNGIIPLGRLLEIPDKYGIGKRPLSLLLGWGEMTMSRYCDGDMPTKQYSDILSRIYDDPKYYLELLESGKSNLKSLTAYEKSKRVVETLVGNKEAPQTKLDMVVDYVLYKCEDITPLALQKALYYIQGFYYAFTESFMFEDDCEAWAHGPVYKEIYQKYSAYRFDPIEGSDETDDKLLSSNEKTIIDSVIRNLCCYSGKVLENFTHSEEPWLKTRGDLPPSVASNRLIHKNVIGDYFKIVKEHELMLNPSDIEKYARKMFKQTI